MKSKIKILIVEDDMIIAANIAQQLSKIGYEVLGIETRGEDAIIHSQVNTPDIILMDINLKGQLNGIETAALLKGRLRIPVIYLTANNDEATFARAKQTGPHAFISKPFSSLNLERTIALVAQQLVASHEVDVREGEALKVLKDRIFIRHHGKMMKLMLDQILYIEADRNYCQFVTRESRYLIVSTLKTLHRELPSSHFLRVHRSYMVNIFMLDVLADGYLQIGKKVIPVSRSYRDTLMARLHTI